jgi:hypothetical protein
LKAAMAITADYLPTDTEHRNPSDFTPELSRRARGVDVWAALRSLGRRGVEDLVERCCSHARRFADGLRAGGYEILNEVVLNQVLVSFGDDDTTGRVIDEIQRDGTCWCGGTVWQGRRAMRIRARRLYDDNLYDFATPQPSYWEATAPPPAFSSPALQTEESCDVAIIGGGYTGLSAAYHLARDHGSDGRVLEAGHIGWGASGRNGGFCCIGGTGLQPRGMIRRFGLDAARAWYRSQV